MREVEERKKDEKAREGSEKEEYTPLGAIDPGSGGESVHDPSFLHAGWREEANFGPPEASRERHSSSECN